MNKGDKITVTLGPFDVLNLESTGIPGDLSGTAVQSDRPVAVFTGGERGIAPYDVQPPAPQGYKVTRSRYMASDARDLYRELGRYGEHEAARGGTSAWELGLA